MEFCGAILRNLADAIAHHVGFRATDGAENAVRYSEDLLGFVKRKYHHKNIEKIGVIHRYEVKIEESEDVLEEIRMDSGIAPDFVDITIRWNATYTPDMPECRDMWE